MRKAIQDPQIYSMLGLFGLLIAVPMENKYVNTILVPISILFLLISGILIIRKLLNKNKDLKEISKLRFDISLRMTLLSVFSSLFSVVGLIVLVIMLNKENLELARYFIFFAGCIQTIIVIISFVVLLKMLVKKNNN